MVDTSANPLVITVALVLRATVRVRVYYNKKVKTKPTFSAFFFVQNAIQCTRRPPAPSLTMSLRRRKSAISWGATGRIVWLISFSGGTVQYCRRGNLSVLTFNEHALPFSNGAAASPTPAARHCAPHRHAGACVRWPLPLLPSGSCRSIPIPQ